MDDGHGVVGVAEVVEEVADAVLERAFDGDDGEVVPEAALEVVDGLVVAGEGVHGG